MNLSCSANKGSTHFCEGEIVVSDSWLVYIYIGGGSPEAFATSGSLYLINPTCHGQKVRDHGGDTRKEASWAVGRQQRNSRTAICSCVRGGTRALTRAQQNDFQQVTRVHAPVPPGWCEGPLCLPAQHTAIEILSHTRIGRIENSDLFSDNSTVSYTTKCPGADRCLNPICPRTPSMVSASC